MAACGVAVLLLVPGCGRAPVIARSAAAGTTTSAAVPQAGRPSLPAPSTAQATVFSAALHGELANRSGTVSAAVLDLSTGRSYTLGTDAPVYTASIVKVAILASLLHQDEMADISLSAADRKLAALMIEQSDNDATTALWREQGGESGLLTLFHLAGMTQTTTAATVLEPWDGIVTTAYDQVRLLQRLFTTGTILTTTDAAYELEEMSKVEPSQRWGITAGTSATWNVSLKNGWLPLSGKGWVVNSIGRVQHGPHAFLIAILGSGAPSMAYGIGSIELVARDVAAQLGG